MAVHLRRLSPPAIGWGSGAAKREILDPAAGAVGSITTGYNPFEGRHVLIDISGLAHIAAP